MNEQGILGIDFGIKNVGLAVAYLPDGIPDPLKTVPLKTIWQEIEKLIKNYGIIRIVIGFPLRSDGKEDKIMMEVKNFVGQVKNKFNLPVILWDERFTTQGAEEILKTNQGRRKKHIDHYSAALILEEYFASLPS